MPDTFISLASGDDHKVPLNKLVPDPKNVRRTPVTAEAVAKFAASIQARGLMQELHVRPVIKDGKKTGTYAVTAGGVRLQALQLLAQQKFIAKNAPIKVVVVDDAAALEISLAENTIREPMHPIDEMEAWRALIEDEGKTVAEIAARFGVTPAVVRQRLKLAKISPKLLDEYRAGNASLAQLQALALTDDHAEQERVWIDVPLGWHATRWREPHQLRHTLQNSRMPATHWIARFVGLDAYCAEGGAISEDLFEDAQYVNRSLMGDLARRKLEQAAEKIRADEGWKWATATLGNVAKTTGEYFHLDRDTELSAEEQAESQRLEAEAAELADDDPRLAEINARLIALYEPDYSDIHDIGGIILSLNDEGGVEVTRGFIRHEDDPRDDDDDDDDALPAVAADDDGEDADLADDEAADDDDGQGEAADGEDAASLPADGPTEPVSKALPASLVAELTAQRTAALRVAVAQDPMTALNATLYALLVPVMAIRNRLPRAALHAKVEENVLAGFAPGIKEAAATAELDRITNRWISRVASAPDAWAFLRALPLNEKLDLLAVLVAPGIDAVISPTLYANSDRRAHADKLAADAEVDMTAWWTADAIFLYRLNKAQILDAVREGAGEDHARRLDARNLKKPDLVAAAAAALEGKNWLPDVLRTPAPAPKAEDTPSDVVALPAAA